MKHSYYCKLNDRSLSTNNYLKKDGTNVRAILKGNLRKTLIASMTLVISYGCSAEEPSLIETIRVINSNDTLVYIPESKNHVLDSGLAYIKAGHVYKSPIPIPGNAKNAIVVISDFTFNCSMTTGMITSSEVTNKDGEVWNYEESGKFGNMGNNPFYLDIYAVACDLPEITAIVDKQYQPKKVLTQEEKAEKAERSSPYTKSQRAELEAERAPLLALNKANDEAERALKDVERAYKRLELLTKKAEVALPEDKVKADEEVKDASVYLEKIKERSKIAENNAVVAQDNYDRK